jgi:hypothetical protein
VVGARDRSPVQVIGIEIESRAELTGRDPGPLDIGVVESDRLGRIRSSSGLIDAGVAIGVVPEKRAEGAPLRGCADVDIQAAIGLEAGRILVPAIAEGGRAVELSVSSFINGRANPLAVAYPNSARTRPEILMQVSVPGMYQKPSPCTEQTRTYSTGAAFLVGRSAAAAPEIPAISAADPRRMVLVIVIDSVSAISRPVAANAAG